MAGESRFQAHVRKRLLREFPGCFILKNDSGYMQGIPDYTVFYEKTWAMLEVKDSMGAPERPNQRYYVGLFNELSFAAFIYPENEEEVFRGLQQAFSPRRHSRFSKR